MERRASVLLMVMAGAFLTRCDVPPQVEVSRFECRAVEKDFEAFGTVKNISEGPIELTANIALDMEADTEMFTSDVRPRPLGPGEEGRFHLTDEIPGLAFGMGGADCWLDPFSDENGRKLDYVLTGAAAKKQNQ